MVLFVIYQSFVPVIILNIKRRFFNESIKYNVLYGNNKEEKSKESIMKTILKKVNLYWKIKVEKMLKLSSAQMLSDFF